MAVQQMARLEGMDLLEGGKQSLGASFLQNRRAEVRHQDVADEEHALLRHVNQKRYSAEIGQSTAQIDTPPVGRQN